MLAHQVLGRAVESFRVEATRKLDLARRIELGQFLTPWPVAKFMAAMCGAEASEVRILDAGAGVGSLTAAVVAELCGRERRPHKLFVVTYELDGALIEYLYETLGICEQLCVEAGVQFGSEIRSTDFIRSAASTIATPLLETAQPFDLAILNPPYRKINRDSDVRHSLRSVGIETSNLYTAFLSLVSRLLSDAGELIAITPRSFCNGPYFRPFREDFLRRMAFQRIHVFDSREALFRDDSVLQENVIFRAVRKTASVKYVTLTMSRGIDDTSLIVRHIEPCALVHPGDRELFLHIVPDDANQRISDCMSHLPSELDDLGVSVSTGRVVDFRAKPFLRSYPEPDCAPLIHPCHFNDGFVVWPKLNGKKPNSIVVNQQTMGALVPRGAYALTKRFSAKEEPRRVVAALYDPSRVAEASVGFENHVNYYHREGEGLPLDLAKGLVAYLNSTFVDTYFRQFNGHTQVNSADLRKLRYPSVEELEELGRKVGEALSSNTLVDNFVDAMLPA
ncbi:MAG TPA: Eco57I restriction-modification methylase domain-containing protein [Terriglobia bacterium]|nr:Eco57I restriction-modification methylase domain-containing protein [Terriglobia bacterium]